MYYITLCFTRNITFFWIAFLSLGICLGLCATTQITSTDFHCIPRDNASYSDTQDGLVEPTPPYASFIRSHNVTLGWKAANISDAAYIIQWKYVHIASDWHYTQIVTETSYTVSNLQPYTEYWFRVIWIICQLHFPSSSSLAYRTLAFGEPSGPPIIEDPINTNPDSIEVSWFPPMFPSGPIIGYNLKLSADKENPRYYSVTGKQNFQFYATKPGTTYRFSISAVNERGEGPAAEANITTLNSTVQHKHQWLFLSRNNTLKKRENLKDTFYESKCLTVQSRISGISVNIYTGEVYFSEQNHIWVKGANNMTDMSDLRILYTGLGSITSISVDWLYNKMYFVMSNQVHTCNLKNCTSVHTIPLQPGLSLRKIVTDPFNGYIFLLVEEGIQRIILPQTLTEDMLPNHIIKSSNILDFIVNVHSKILFYAVGNNGGNTSIISVFLDGSTAQYLRHIEDNSISEIRSFVYDNDSLLFTNGYNVYQEEFLNNKYWYNEFLVACNLFDLPFPGYNNFILYGESTQPFPLPSQPQDVMVLLGTESAAIVWKPPKSSIESSPAAWQDWIYTIIVTAQDPDMPHFFANISSTTVTIKDLNVSTKYQVTVQASSPAGQSPWTPPLVGTTLQPADEEPYFLATGPGGIWRQSLDKFGPGELISDKLTSISDLDWYNNTLFWSTKAGQVYMWEMPYTVDNSPIQVTEIRRSGPISFDWLGHCIYWSDKVNATIFRKHINTADIEQVIPGNYLVNDMAVDSINAFLYWSTSYTLESSKLNGQKHYMIQNLTLFTSTQIVGLTLDITRRHLYWLVKDGLNINLYRAVLREDGSPDPPEITTLTFWSSSEISQHALMYYSDRLFWINGQNYLTVQEVSQSTCTPFSQPAECTAFTLVLNYCKPLPGNFLYAPEVLPDPIPSSSFEIQGDHKMFHIIWKESLNVDYGIVFYCVESNILQTMFGMGNTQCLTPENFTDPFYTVHGLEPYTEFDFSVTPFTYWRRATTTKLTLRAPEGVPSPPLNPRIYLLHNTFDKENVGLEMRWDNPKMPNGALTNFTISYRLTNEILFRNSTDAWTTLNVTALSRSLHLLNLSPGLLIEFKVQAYTSKGPGPFSDIKKGNTSDVRPVPSIFSLSSTEVALVDLDREEVSWVFSVEERMKAISYTAYDGKLYYTLSDLLFIRDTSNLSTFLLLQDERLSDCQSMTLDWIARHLYVSIHSQQNGQQVYAIDLEQKKKGLKQITNVQLSVNTSLEALAAYALQSRLYWIERWDMDRRRISYYNIENGTIEHVLGYKNKIRTSEASTCNCHVEPSGRSMALDLTDTDNPYIYFLSNATDIWISDLEGCHCVKVFSIPLLSETALVTSLAVDDYSIYWSNTDKENTTVFQTSKHAQLPSVLQTSQDPIQVMAFSASLQPFPDKTCLLLAHLTTRPVILSTSNTSLTLQLPTAVTNASCAFIISPTPTYRVKYRKLIDNTTANYPSRNISSTLEFQDQIALIPGLQPYSNYEIEVTVENYYSLLFSEQPLGTMVTAKTDYGVPEAVDTVVITVLSDSLLNITWTYPHEPNGPLASIRYQITSNLLFPNPIAPWREDEFPDEQLAWSFTGLRGGTNYQFKVLAFHPYENWFSESAPVYATTFAVPGVPKNIVPGNTSLVLQWRSPEEAITNYYFEIKELKGRDWVLPLSTSCTDEAFHTCTLTGMVPNTYYHVRAVVAFWTEATGFSDPAEFKTSAGVPSKPDAPQSLATDKNTIRWFTSEDNGSNLTYNILEYTRMEDDGRDAARPWHVAYNGTCPDICVWKSTTMEGTFRFRAAAANMLGLSNYSDVSESIILTKESSSTNDVVIILAISLPLLSVILLIAAFVVYKRTKHKHKQTKEKPVFSYEDKELSALRGVSKTVGLANACYAVRTLPTQVEMQTLPQFPRERLTLCVFLGSGAFGEVYEGNAIDILGSDTGITKVAVKTLKSDATDQEKSEFLKEAHLMSQFDHPNILKLLGVCLFNEPQYIILELMDGGDLLSYLRGARPDPPLQIPLLSALDFLDISINICKGCAYLEKMHFVHRDLAARNCLVSVKEYNNPARTVKIGDFGLARDIYSYDYYRKKGEGLLPVRWMAPESLIDGIFTSRGDVWSFGIILWEIFSLGQQPYPGYSNLEVLHHVRSGQRMEPPENCFDDMWDLILKCWAQDASKRPTFFYLQRQLEDLKHCSLRWSRVRYRRANLEGILNPAFEDSDDNVVGIDAEGIDSLTLTETRNAEGLNYLMVATV
ncbi:proto-oncogene tyrosine-protein kinase ROS [Pelobates fuscus]|uniref:proto-oncogene tyrosine-protein kinase ROS n=1 Tax=Pelobates fuscus TaxID=191477 RepID=UPI002FE4DDA0